MAKTPTRAATAPFAHLLSLVTGKSPKAEEDTPAEDAEDEETETDAEDENPSEDAEGDKPEEDASAEDEKPEGKRARKGAKAAEKDDDEEAESKAESDDDDEEMAQARREGYAAAQARGRRIFGSAAAGLRPDMAAHLAFNDAMPSAQAIGMLEMAASGTVPAASAGGSRLHRRMARVVTPNPGSGGGKKPEEMSFADMAKAAAIKAGIITE